MMIFPIGDGFRVETNFGNLDWVPHSLSQEETIQTIVEFVEGKDCLQTEVDELQDENANLEETVGRLERRLEDAIEDDDQLKCPHCNKEFEAKKGLV